MPKIIGVISDTHGIVRDEVKAAFKEVDRIIHAGDIGSANVIAELESIAPLTIIKGNVDKGDWATELRDEVVIEIEGHLIYVLHNIAELQLDPAEHFSVIVYGHSHVPKNETTDGVLYFNPGSAGPRRFKLPISIGKLLIDGEKLESILIILG